MRTCIYNPLVNGKCICKVKRKVITLYKVAITESARSTKNKIIMYTCHLKTLFTLSDIQQSIAIGINLATKYKNAARHIYKENSTKTLLTHSHYYHQSMILFKLL
jgi:hypothetical protein